MEREAVLKLIQNEALWAKIVAANTVYASLAGSPQDKLTRALRELSGDSSDLQPLIAQLQASVEAAAIASAASAANVASAANAGVRGGVVASTAAGGAGAGASAEVHVGASMGAADASGRVDASAASVAEPMQGVSLSCVQSNAFILFQGPYELLGLCSDEELARLSLYLGVALYAKEIAKVVLKKDKAKLLAAVGQDSYRFVMDYARYATGALGGGGNGGSIGVGNSGRGLGRSSSSSGGGGGGIGSFSNGGGINHEGSHEGSALGATDGGGHRYRNQQPALLPLELNSGAEELRGFFMQQGRALLLQVVQQFTDPYLKGLLLMRLEVLADAVLSVLSPKARQEDVLEQQRQRQLTLSCQRIYNLVIAVLKRGDPRWTQCLS